MTRRLRPFGLALVALLACQRAPFRLIIETDGQVLACPTGDCPDGGDRDGAGGTEGEAEAEGEGGCRAFCGACDCSDPPMETCNATDDDCDCEVDEAPLFAGMPCDPRDQTDPEPFSGELPGLCEPGTLACIGGTFVCVGGVGPVAESCDGEDNDCDGERDEVFLLASDRNNCGACGRVCALDNALADCAAGECRISLCAAGFVDADCDEATGCEYPCTPTGPEVCDGRDNDCDGFLDDDDLGTDVDCDGVFDFAGVDRRDGAFVELADNPCPRLGGCAGSFPVCRGARGWGCRYPDAVCVDPDTGYPVLAESLCEGGGCDGFDNDCDVATDEDYPQVGTDCSGAGVGQCAAAGVYRCAADRESVECCDPDDAATCRVPTPGAPSDEVCDGIDNDCDGEVDESDPGEPPLDATVLIDAPVDFHIYQYEASRPGARDDDPGRSSARACSRPGVLPWTSATVAQARAACAAAGKHLCTAAEWERACAGAAGRLYPYGDVYDPCACNGNEFDPDACADGDLDPDDVDGTDAVLATGSQERCVTPEEVYDLSGNAREWTDDPVPAPPAAPRGYRSRGGSTSSPAQGLRCDFTFTVLPADFAYSSVGFRCCCVPGVDRVCP